MGEMRTRENLLELERTRSGTLRHLLGEVPESRTEETSLTPEGWSVRDLAWHLACWNDVVTTQLELIKTGRFDDRSDRNTEENNARFLATGQSVTCTQALSALETSRGRAIRAMRQLEEVPPPSGGALLGARVPAHRRSPPELRRFIGRSDAG